MSMSDHLLKRAISFWKKGKKEEARKIFQAIIYNDEQNDLAWIWYAYSLKTNNEKRTVLEEFLKIFPDHSVGKRALETLREKEYRATERVERQQQLAESPSLLKSKPKQRHPSRYFSVPRAIMVSGIFMLFLGVAVFLLRYKNLEAEYEALMAREAILSQKHAQLYLEHETLKDEKIVLSNSYASLVAQYDALGGEYSNLRGTYDALYLDHANLINNYNGLLDDYNYAVESYSAFREVAIAPPYIYTRERKVHLVFKKLDGSLLRWTIDASWLENHLRSGDELRAKLVFGLPLHNDLTDETYYVVDGRDFVDTTPFTYLMEDLYYASPDEYTFIKEVWNIVAQLTAYTSEIDEIPRFPMETLLTGGGDCEDHAILFASMIMASPVSWDVNFIYMDSYHPTQPETVNHVIVEVVTPNSSYLVEATSKDTMNPYSEGVYGWTFGIYEQ